MPSQENTSHIQNLKGPKAIMWTLAANIEQQNRIISKLHISFFFVFSLFLSCHEHERARSYHGRKREFEKILCHPKHGAPVYILSNNFIALCSYDVDYKELFEELLNSREKFFEYDNLTKETVDK